MGKPRSTHPHETSSRTPGSIHPPGPLSLTRREALQGLGAAALPLFACGDGPPAPLPSGPFPLGVASGDASPTGALLWTRYAGTSRLQARVWRSGAPSPDPVLVAPDVRVEQGFVRLEVDGLAPGTRYTYAFVEDGGTQESPVGQFRTALAPDALEPLRVGATSCTHFGFPMTTLERAAARSELDVLLWLGDACYNDGALTPDEFRASWMRTLAEPGQRAVRSAHSLLATWDDHEFTNDWDRETLDPGRFTTAGNAFFEHVPMRRLAGTPERLWRSVRWGRTAEFFLLDCRGERRPSTRLTAGAEYLGRKQMDWLKSGLRNSPAVFKLVLNSVPISEFPGAFFQSTAADRWEGFAAQRTELLSYIESSGIPGVLFVAGDFHLASMGRVSRTGPGARLHEVLVGPGANVSNPSPSYPAPPQFDWSSGINNYAVLELEPGRREVTVRYHDARDAVLTERTWAL
ncbi:MAG: alkaline phosphatase D family protein [Myxococcaceae bacterium]|nr:alkaline phosphatase D family protein [Myxococcaceae bacterium]